MRHQHRARHSQTFDLAMRDERRAVSVYTTHLSDEEQAMSFREISLHKAHHLPNLIGLTGYFCIVSQYIKYCLNAAFNRAIVFTAHFANCCRYVERITHCLNTYRRSQIASALLATLALFASGASPAAPGDLDVFEFGNNGNLGYAVHPLTTLGNHRANAIALQTDGKTVLVGSCPGAVANKDYFCVMRMLTDGARDNTFVAGTGFARTAITSLDDEAEAVVVQPDGKILVAGTCGDDFCLARYNANGTLDLSFNAVGYRVVSVTAGRDAAKAVALQPDGKKIVGGDCEVVQSPSARWDFCVARLNADGTSDNSFGILGRVTTSVGSGSARAYSMAIYPSGKILLAGECVGAVNIDFCLVRYTTSGALDDSSQPGINFGTDGKRIHPIGAGDDRALSVVLQPDNLIVVAGECDAAGANENFCIARLGFNGSLDTTFSSNGFTVTNVSSPSSRASSIAMQPDGKIVVVGYCNASVAGSEACITRYEPDGGIDATFVGSAVPVLGKTARDRFNAALVQLDGKIVAAGSCEYTSGVDTNSVFCAARYESGPFAYRQCTPDVDGDGRMTATVDGLILTRVMLGLRGSAVLGGITFPSEAIRKVWGGGAPNDIRQFLVTQCGMNL
jgi:uncharacterized delta-60 repeat protein